jgi:hypothetical protein
MYNIKFCVLCKTEAEYKSVNNMDTEYYCKCPNCGGYFVTEQFIKFHEYNIPLHLLSGYVREKNEIGVKDIHVTCDNYNDILNSSLMPRLLNDKVDKLVQYMYRKTGYFGENVSINNSIEFAICYALNQVELRSIISLLQELKYIKLDTIGGDKDGYVLTYEGIKYAVELDKKVKTSNIAFVAMWFNEKMNNIYKNAIEPAIEIDKKYKAFKMDNHEHNNDITDEINCRYKKLQIPCCRFNWVSSRCLLRSWFCKRVR